MYRGGPNKISSLPPRPPPHQDRDECGRVSGSANGFQPPGLGLSADRLELFSHEACRCGCKNYKVANLKSNGYSLLLQKAFFLLQERRVSVRSKCASVRARREDLRQRIRAWIQRVLRQSPAVGSAERDKVQGRGLLYISGCAQIGPCFRALSDGFPRLPVLSSLLPRRSVVPAAVLPGLPRAKKAAAPVEDLSGTGGGIAGDSFRTGTLPKGLLLSIEHQHSPGGGDSNADQH